MTIRPVSGTGYLESWCPGAGQGLLNSSTRTESVLSENPLG